MPNAENAPRVLQKFTLITGIAVAIWGVGCIFDPKLPKPVQDFNQSQIVDTIYPSSSTPDRTVELYWPILDFQLGKGKVSKALSYPPVNVKEKFSGQIVRYHLIKQAFGSWSPELEFKWNYFLLQGNFIFPEAIPDTVGMQAKTQNLYNAIHRGDHFTNYFDSAMAPEILNRIQTSTKTGAIGISVKVPTGSDTIVVQQVIADSPAGRAGIQIGMRILAINDSSVVGDSALTRFGRFSVGDSGESVKLTLLGTQGVFPVSLIRLPVAFPTVQTDSLAEQVGYISINAFTPSTVGDKSTYTEFRDALMATQKFPITLIDLRDNGGGSLDIAIKMCDEVLTDSTIIIRQRERRYAESARVAITSELVSKATSGGYGEKDKLGAPRRYLLLANGNSASASEILIIALKEGAKAPLMGTKTYGKGVGQTVRVTPGMGLALVTILKFTSASGLEYHNHGIEPDFIDSSNADITLVHATQKAQELLGLPLAKPASQGEDGQNFSEPEKAILQRAAAIEWNRRQAIRKTEIFLD
jgi:carboxyl-terminal processing protease